jgi:hypothetical protein
VDSRLHNTEQSLLCRNHLSMPDIDPKEYILIVTGAGLKTEIQIHLGGPQNQIQKARGHYDIAMCWKPSRGFASCKCERVFGSTIGIAKDLILL